ncbi:hypothetical protein O8C99_00065 [Aliarcobacter butzleri]|uniref:hypothetical protein n=1 Tax=Aliarcobacter butzleri TaxID=28197 RepID=UPI00263D6963|nr:hypothetical protein [Aliarcobacter butzleri]MDN5101570.1 hypothetical protein [Aliarcobacter butzleri]
MKEKIKNYILNEITKANEDFEVMCRNDIFEDNRLIEISFLINYDENSINELLKKSILSDEKLDYLFYLVKTYKLNAIVLIKFLILKCNLEFNRQEKISNNKSRFDKQILERKQIFDIAQKYSSEQDYRDIPRRDLDLLYGFREYLTRYKFCTDEEIRILLSIIGYQKLPPMPKEWKELNRKWVENIVNDTRKFLEQNKNKFNKTDTERKEFSENFYKTIHRANKYKPKKL